MELQMLLLTELNQILKIKLWLPFKSSRYFLFITLKKFPSSKPVAFYLVLMYKNLSNLSLHHHLQVSLQCFYVQIVSLLPRQRDIRHYTSRDSYIAYGQTCLS